MRVRATSPAGDMTFGQSGANFYVDSSAGVAQLIRARLSLTVGDWFLDTTAGTPWNTQVLGSGTRLLYDQAIRSRVLGTPGVLAIKSYSSSLDTQRNLTVEMSVVTRYGSEAVTFSYPPSAGAS